MPGSGAEPRRRPRPACRWPSSVSRGRRARSSGAARTARSARAAAAAAAVGAPTCPVHDADAGAVATPGAGSLDGPVDRAGLRVHRLVGQRVGAGVAGRGIQPNRTEPNLAHEPPRLRASGFIAGCLTCQRPDICSTTSLESIRTSTSVAPSSSAARSPAIRPWYSATLLVATPRPSARSASTSRWPRRAPRRRSPRDRGCRASRRRPRRSRFTDPTPSCGPGSRRIPRSARTSSSGAAAQPRDLAAVELEPARPAATRPAAAPRRRPAARGACRSAASRSAGSPATSLVAGPAPALLGGVDVGERRVAPLGDRRESCLLAPRPAPHARGRRRRRGLALLHDLEQLVLQDALAAGQRLQLVLQVVGLLGADVPAP